MNASKEQARKAIKALASWPAGPSPSPPPERTFVLEFLQVAVRKLPSEEAYRRQRSRTKARRT